MDKNRKTAKSDNWVAMPILCSFYVEFRIKFSKNSFEKSHKDTEANQLQHKNGQF